MTDILLLLLFNALAITGFHLTTGEGMLLEFIRAIKLPAYLSKPLYDCPTCMASIHSIYFFIPYCAVSGTSVYLWPLYVLTLAGLSTIVYRVTECLENKMM